MYISFFVLLIFLTSWSFFVCCVEYTRCWRGKFGFSFFFRFSFLPYPYLQAATLRLLRLRPEIKSQVGFKNLSKCWKFKQLYTWSVQAFPFAPKHCTRAHKKNSLLFILEGVLNSCKLFFGVGKNFRE